METKAPNPAEKLPEANHSALLRVYFEVNQLKRLYRQGWLRRGVPKIQTESVAEHTFSLAVLGMVLTESLFPDLDSLRVLRMALIHDFGEIYAGDLVPEDRVPEAEKQRFERKAVQEVLGKLPDGAVYLALWEEYERGESPEARLVRQLDRLDMALQAAVYAQDGFLDPEEFFQSARRVIQAEPLLAVLAELEAL